jgi:predicted secreted Zn-dependent protease
MLGRVCGLALFRCPAGVKIRAEFTKRIREIQKGFER